MFVDGFIAPCSAIGASTATEIGTGGRQRVGFNLLSPYLAGVGAARAVTNRAANGTSFFYPFGTFAPSTTVVGFAVFDAAAGGNLLLTIPFGSGTRPAAALSAFGPWQPGDLVLEGVTFDPAYSGAIAAGATVGSCYDRSDIVGPRTPEPGEAQGADGYVMIINRGTLTACAALTVNRGVLQAASTFPSAA